MQKVSIICVGKMKEKFYMDAAAEYVKRLSRFCKLEITELPEERLPEAPSPAQIEAALFREAEVIRSKLPPSAAVIALCVEGQTMSSEALAAEKLSMSPMTFPHHLARVMLLEQVYRAYQINARSKYHK